jgi:outer membrane immunogenic protein
LGIARDRWLAYATGGLAYGELKVTNTGSFHASPTGGPIPDVGIVPSVTTSGMKAGWAAGVGGAYAWSDTVSLFAEWTRIDLGSRSAVTALPATDPAFGGGISFSGSARADVKARFDVISAGLNLKL